MDLKVCRGHRGCHCTRRCPQKGKKKGSSEFRQILTVVVLLCMHWPFGHCLCSPYPSTYIWPPCISLSLSLSPPLSLLLSVKCVLSLCGWWLAALNPRHKKVMLPFVFVSFRIDMFTTLISIFFLILYHCYCLVYFTGFRLRNVNFAFSEER